jgi:hypothetical protein
MNKTVVDIRLNTGEPNKVVIDGIDMSHTVYLLLEFRGGCPTRYVVGTRKPKSLREKIATWLLGGGK